MKSRAEKIKLDLNKQAKMRLMVGLALCQALAVPVNAYAQWEGLENQHGQASYQYNGNHLEVTVTTSTLIANAQSLSIAGNESVRVNQLAANNTALFRSIGPSATKIFGSLTSNGNLFLINQNGVLFGQGAQVNVGGLVASSMNISNADFLSGKYQFNANGSANGVANQGVIKVSDGGYLVLLGNTVNNSGSLAANNGSVVMASAGSAVLDFYGNGLVKANLSGDALNAVVEQSGVIQADGGAIQLATNSRSSAVNVSGLVQANSLVERNGVIRLEGGSKAQVSVSGTLSAAGNQAGTTGGNIEVTGEQVALISGAKLDASGNAGGGQVLVGGDYQGKNTQVQNARTTYIDRDTTILVDAIETGDGGKAIVWADQITRYYGNISAKGGAASGNGGFVEVSGKQVLDFIGGVDVSAAYGLGGQVLLDPENIILNNSTQSTPPNNPNGTPDIAYADAPLGGTTTIQISDVRGFSELFLQATQDITVANNLYMQTNNSIVFTAGRDIHVNAGIRTYGTGSTSLQAGNDINVNAEIRAYGTGNIGLSAVNNINVGARMYNFGTGYIGLIADADTSGAGDVTINQRVYTRQGDIVVRGVNINNTNTGTMIQTQGLVGQNSGNVAITASNTVNLAGNITTAGRNGSIGVDGANAGTVNITAGGAVTIKNISSYGGKGGTGNIDGGNAGTITIGSTAAGDINTGTLNSRNGAARGTGTGGAQGGINITNASGGIATKNLYAHGNTSGAGGNINLAATGGDITITGNVYAQGGTTASGSTASGTNGGNINLNAASSDVSVTGRVYAQGGGVGSGNIAVGGNGGNVTVVGNNLSFNNVVYSYGNSGRGLHQSGGNAGNISLSAGGEIATKNVYAYGGRGGTGAGSNADGGDAGTITIASTGIGDISTGNVNARNGQARGAGAGGGVGSVAITNANGNITTKNIDTYGNSNGHGGAIDVVAAAGDVTVAGRVYSFGGGVNNGHTLAGRNGGNINISGVNRTITNRINANGNAAKGIDQAGGNAGTVSVTGTGTLNVVDVYSRNGNATGAGAGGSVGGITLSGSAITATKTISTAGGKNGNAGNIGLTTTSGDINTKAVLASGGGASTNTAGNNAGNITINSAGAVMATNLYVQGSSGKGANNNGGNAGTITVNANGAIGAARVYAYGGNGGGNNALSNTAAGGNAGQVALHSTGVGDITLSQDVNVRTGYSRGSAAGATAGAINIKNDNGNITTKNIRADGQNHGDGGNVSLDAGTTGDVTVNGVIYTYGDRDATASTFVGTNAGDITIKSANTTVTSTINANGGRGRGVNQAGGDAGTVTFDATGAIATQAIAASGGNGGAGAGSNASGGDAGNIKLTSTGAGDILTTNITARTGYSRGGATGGAAGSVDIKNDNGSLTTGNITTRGQRKGAGGNVTAVTTGGNISVGIVDARASNIPAVNGGDVILATNQNATVPNVLTGGRWLIYSTKPANNTVGASLIATAAFEQFNTPYGGAIPATGNGFLYAFDPNAPVIDPNAGAGTNLNPRNTAGLGELLNVNEQPQQFLAVFNVDATAAGGDFDPDAEGCAQNEDKKSQNPNTSLMLNFGVNLPEGVKQTCI